ncbi:MAG: hypothetical protein ABUS47_14480 [Steroidobacter sp.]
MLVDADSYLLELIRYIHLNPVRARIADSPSEYLWSSHHAYAGTRNEPWVTTHFALAMFHRELSVAVNAYQRFMLCETSRSSPPLLQCNPNDLRILGSNTFIASLGTPAWQAKSHKTLECIVTEACNQFSVDHDALVSRCRDRHLSFVRAWIAHQVLLLKICSLAQVARFFNRDEATIRESVKTHFNYP